MAQDGPGKCRCRVPPGRVWFLRQGVQGPHGTFWREVLPFLVPCGCSQRGCCEPVSAHLRPLGPSACDHLLPAPARRLSRPPGRGEVGGGASAGALAQVSSSSYGAGHLFAGPTLLTSSTPDGPQSSLSTCHSHRTVRVKFAAHRPPEGAPSSSRQLSHCGWCPWQAPGGERPCRRPLRFPALCLHTEATLWASASASVPSAGRSWLPRAAALPTPVFPQCLLITALEPRFPCLHRWL